MADFLTTKEVAALLRIKERTVYDLVKEGSIPVSRVTGKLLFPRELVEAWVRRNAETEGGIEAVMRPPPVLAGSHDPLLEWAIRESGSGIATFSTVASIDCRVSGKARLSHAAFTSMNRNPRTGISITSVRCCRECPW